MSSTQLQDDYFKAGDIVGFSGRCKYSVIINLGTGGIPFWSLSHVGVIANAPGDRLLLYESTDDSGPPCEILGKPVVGVQAHVPSEVIAGYEGRVWHYPLYRPLYIHEGYRLEKFLLAAIGKPYDKAGAIRSGGFIVALIESLFRGQDLKEFFCSELVAGELAYTGIFATTNASKWNPNRLIRRLRLNGIVGAPRRQK